jgi:hypothetical protein
MVFISHRSSSHYETDAAAAAVGTRERINWEFVSYADGCIMWARVRIGKNQQSGW